MFFKKDAQQKQTESRQVTRPKSQQKFKQSRKKIHYSIVPTHVLVEEDLEDPQPSTSRGRYKRIASRHPEKKKSTVSIKFKNMKFM